MRPIDADNLLKALKAEDIDISDLVGKIRKSERLLCIQYINMAPTVNERPQGEWKEFKYGLYYCSRCFERVDKDIERIDSLVSKGERSNYCPACGAKMGGTT